MRFGDKAGEARRLRWFDGAGRQKEKRKTTEKVYRVTEEDATDGVRRRQMIHSGNTQKDSVQRKEPKLW